MADQQQTDVLIMDFAKAFDKVNHSLLLHKLHHYGIRGQTWTWISNFLSDRQQSVVVDGFNSNPVSVRSGVPQGSVLGPCLFLAYINDLPANLSSGVRLFADDTALSRTITSPQDQAQLQQDLNRLADWEKSWAMEFHPGKCNTLTVTRKHTTLVKDYVLHGTTLQPVESSKYL